MFKKSSFCRLFASLMILMASKVAGQIQPIVAEGFPILVETARTLTSRNGPMLADLDRDGRLDILFASGQKVFAFRHDGRLLPGWPQATEYIAHVTPAVGDLDGDGNLEVVTFDREGLTQKSLLYAWKANGNRLPDFPLTLGLGDSPVALYDLDNDGKLEIIGSFGQKCYVFRHDGNVFSGWPFNLAPSFPLSKPAVGDVNQDGRPDIVVAVADSLRPTLPDDTGRLYVWTPSGQLLQGWPATMIKDYNFFYGCDPALVDIKHDGFLEIAVGTTRVGPREITGYAALYRYDGTLMPGWPQYTAGTDTLSGFTAGPAVADLDADGDPELLFGDYYDHVIAWEGDGSVVPNWPVFLGQIEPTLVFRSVLANPSIGDVDGDGNLEIFISNNQSNLVNGIWLGQIFAFNHDGTHVSWSPLRPRQFASQSTASMGDLDNDSTLELITVSADGDDNEAWLTVWKVPGVPYVKERFPWPMYGHDRWHTSQYGFELPDDPVVSVADRKPQTGLPETFALQQNYPNPFSLESHSHATEIRYDLPGPAAVRLRVFNLLGAEVRTLAATAKPAGFHQAQWDGKDESGNALPSGVYFYRLEAAPQAKGAQKVVLTRKLVLLD
jgi:hypothetical protein